MKKLIIIPIVSLLFILTVNVAPSTAVTDYEWDVYWNFVEAWHYQIYQLDGDEATAEDVAQKEITQKYGFDNNRFWTIIDGVLEEKYVDPDRWLVSKSEYEIVDDLYERMDAAGDGATTEDIKDIHREVAGYHGITLFDLHNIEYRTYLDDMMWGFW